MEEDKGRSASPRTPSRRLIAWAIAGALLSAGPAAAREPAPLPAPPPDRLTQDELDLQARSNVVQGSGARAFGMGGAFLARADDATAASWNPAGLSYLRRPEVSLVWSAVNRFNGTVRSPGDGSLLVDERRRGSAPDFVAATYPFELHSITGAAQISFQRVISFTGHRTIDKPEGTTRVDSEGGFDVVAFGSGWHVSRKLRLGATLNRWIDGYDQTRGKPTNLGSTLQKVDFSFSGWNVHLGTIFSPWESLNLGAVGKTGFSGRVDLRKGRTDVYDQQNGRKALTYNNHESTDVVLEFPGAVGLGASWRPRSALTLSADYTRTFWSNGRIKNFFTLPRTALGTPAGQEPRPEAPDDLFPSLPYPVLVDFSNNGQTDTQQTRVGAEYVVILGELKVPLRAGYFRDGQYFRDFSGRAPHFDGWAAGTGLIVGPMLLDVAYVRESARYLGFDNAGGAVSSSVKTQHLLLSAIYRHSRSR